MKRILFAILSLLSLNTRAATLPTGFAEQLLAQNLDPTDLVQAPDGRLFIVIKSGKILIVERDVLLSTVFLDIAVDNFNERGLGHMVLDPQFDLNHYYYVYYTVKDQNHNRVSRFTANGNSTLPGSELILLELDNLSATIHNGGDMAFGADGKLYVTSGDGGSSGNAQSKSVLLGKILRINSDGTIPSDNPFSADGTFTGKNKAIFALGLRNPFSLDIQPGTGKIFVSDVGQATWEEVNYVQAGRNYGWPLIEGLRTTESPPSNYQDPIYTYQHGSGPFQGCAIVGAAFYNPANNQFPSQYTGKFFFGDYCNGYIHYIDPGTGAVQSFASNINRPVGIIVGSDGALYYLARSGAGGGSEQDNTGSNNGTLWKVTYTGSGAPSISVQPQSILAAVGDDVSFLVTASGQQPLSYQWLRDGVPVSGATSASYTYLNAQLSDSGKKFSCVVSNSLGTITTNDALLTMTTNTRPVPQIVITLPNNATLYQAGQSIQFSGIASDNEDGLLPASSLTWKIEFHHAMHVHPGLQPTSGISSGSFPIPHIGETADDVWYRVILTAVDLQGLTKTIYQDVFPQKVIITLKTIPANLSLTLDGQPVQTPYTVSSVVGITRSVEAPPTITAAGSLYTFNSWSQPSMTRIYTFDTPDSNVEFTATYNLVPVGDGNGLVGNFWNKTSQASVQGQPFTGQPVLHRIDPQINFDWGAGTPANEVNNDFFTAQWYGEILPQFSDTYTFYLTGDDGTRLYVDNKLIIDKWVPQFAIESNGTSVMTAGTKYSIRVEYFELSGGALVKLQWGSSKLPKQVIPKSQLFTGVITGLDPSSFSKPIIYPSPAKNEINLHIPEKLNSDQLYSIIDLTGRVLLQGNLSSGQNDWLINISFLNAGYFIIQTNGFSFPFIKNQN